jgi:hypothetical protein
MGYVKCKYKAAPHAGRAPAGVPHKATVVNGVERRSPRRSFTTASMSPSPLLNKGRAAWHSGQQKLTPEALFT